MKLARYVTYGCPHTLERGELTPLALTVVVTAMTAAGWRLIVDSVSEVMDIEGRDLAAAPALGSNLATESRLATVEEWRVTLLQIDKLVGDEARGRGDTRCGVKTQQSSVRRATSRHHRSEWRPES